METLLLALIALVMVTMYVIIGIVWGGMYIEDIPEVKLHHKIIQYSAVITWLPWLLVLMLIEFIKIYI